MFKSVVQLFKFPCVFSFSRSWKGFIYDKEENKKNVINASKLLL